MKQTQHTTHTQNTHRQHIHKTQRTKQEDKTQAEEHNRLITILSKQKQYDAEEKQHRKTTT